MIVRPQTVAILFFLSGVPAVAAEPVASRNQAGESVPRLSHASALRLGRRLDGDPVVRATLASCPADAYQRRGRLAGQRDVSLAACGRDPEACLGACLAGANAHACFHLAEIAQDAHGLDPLYGEALYAMACAAGDAGGCINRAAGLRNTRYAGDPYPKRPVAAREACQLKSFSLGCAAGAAWGCTMRGQAEALGEGLAVDVAAARRDVAKACAIDARFAACTFGKTLLEGLGKPGAPGRPGPDATTIPILDAR